MTDQENELADLIIKNTDEVDGAGRAAQAILKAGYRKMEPVWEGECHSLDINELGGRAYDAGYEIINGKHEAIDKHIKVYVDEVKNTPNKSEAKSVDEKLAAIAKVLDQYGHALLDEPGDKLERKILTALSSFEPKPLEVELFDVRYMVDGYPDAHYTKIKLTRLGTTEFNSRQEAIDFCHKHGLRIKGESNE